MSIENSTATMSFDRMRSMLVRAAEIRDSEQQQVFDALDEIHARLAPLESLGSVRKRLSELPDRTEMSVLAERLDEALAKLEAQDAAIATVLRAVEAVVDRLATPFAELGGRLDGVAGRFEGVAGRMDGLEDRIAGLHKRIDDMDHHLDKQDSRLDALPGAIHGPVRERLDAQTAQLDAAARLDALEARLGELTGSVSARPDTDAVTTLVRTANRDSELRHAAQLDEAMATFAELILGGGAPSQPATRNASRRARKVAPKARDAPDDDADAGSTSS